MAINEKAVKQEVERQMRIILKGASTLIGEEELRENLLVPSRPETRLTSSLGWIPARRIFISVMQLFCVS